MSETLAIEEADFAVIEKLSEEGNVLAEANDFDGAIKKFEEALAIVSQPKNEQEASMWLYSSIGDMYFFKEDFELSSENFYNALNCPDGQSSGFVHLRLGENLFELEQKDNSLDSFMRAFMLEGKEIFDGEDKKYFEFLSEKVELD